MNRASSSLPLMSLKELNQHLEIARETTIDHSMTDIARNAYRYVLHVKDGIVTVEKEDRGDGIERIRITPVKKMEEVL